MTITYIIQQHTGRQYEDIPEGEFQTAEEATAAMGNLESNLGWRSMRIVAESEGRVTEVVALGLEPDE